MYKIQGWVEKGNTLISTGGLLSTTKAQGSFPSALVTVYIHGTGGTLAQLFSDDNAVPTPLANPFTSNSDGTFGFYAASGRYDLVFSGGSLTTPYTLSDVTNGAGGGSGDVVGPSSAVAGDIAVFSGTSGKIIMDSGYSGSSFVLRPSSAVGGHIAVFDSSAGANSKIRDGGTGITSLMTGPASATDGNLAVFDGGSGKIVKDGGAPSSGLIQASKVTLTSVDITTTSTSLVDLTGATLTITTGARRCLVTLSGSMSNANATDQTSSVALVIDGVVQGGTSGLVQVTCKLSQLSNISFSFLTAVLSAGSHTFKIQWKVQLSTGTIYANSTLPLVLSVIETNLTA